MGAVNLQVVLEDELFENKQTLQERQEEVRRALIIKGYVNGKLSTRKVAKMLGMGYEEAQDWLANQGLDTWRELPPDLDEADRKNMQDLIKEFSPTAHL
ncbi:MAG: UPF0175 family protein [Deltaproteobacteria bacterium]|nr:UPF0175 family protein [Deltaproteobacteria bacterium]